MVPVLIIIATASKLNAYIRFAKSTHLLTYIISKNN